MRVLPQAVIEGVEGGVDTSEQEESRLIKMLSPYICLKTCLSRFSVISCLSAVVYFVQILFHVDDFVQHLEETVCGETTILHPPSTEVEVINCDLK